MSGRCSSVLATLRLGTLLVAEATTAWILVASIRASGTLPWTTGAIRWSGEDPLDVVADVATCVALAVLAYLASVTALHLAAVATTRSRSGERMHARVSGLAVRLGPRWLASLAATAALAGVGATGCSTAAPAATPPRNTDDRSIITMTLEVTTPETTTTTSAVGRATGLPPDETPPPVTMRLESDADDAQVPDAEAADAQASDAQVPEPQPPRIAEVARGDNFWAIAEAEVSGRLRRPATADEIAPYWHDLIELNRSRLVDPQNPSLLYAGQQLLLP